MSYRYLSAGADGAVKTWVAISSPGTEDWRKVKVPVLDLYGQNDLPGVLANASKRAAGLTQAGSKQVRMPKADHFYEGMDAPLLEAVSGFLGAHL